MIEHQNIEFKSSWHDDCKHKCYFLADKNMTDIKTRAELIIYNTSDGKSSIALYAKDGSVWLSQNQLAELFATTKQNIGQHISAILKDSELDKNSVVKNYFTTIFDG